jgi:hypothetical protein
MLKNEQRTVPYSVRAGRLPKGKKRRGFKELCWYKDELDSFLKR